MKHSTKVAKLAAIFTAIALTVSGCSSPETPKESVTITDPWIKTTDEGQMSAGYGQIENHTDKEIIITDVATKLSPVTELHETVKDQQTGNMVMRKVEGGFVIKPYETFVLEPGGNHFMLMGVEEAVLPGEVYPFIVTLSTGEEIQFSLIAKEFSGGNENYGDHDG